MSLFSIAVPRLDGKIFPKSLIGFPGRSRLTEYGQQQRSGTNFLPHLRPVPSVLKEHPMFDKSLSFKRGIGVLAMAALLSTSVCPARADVIVHGSRETSV